MRNPVFTLKNAMEYISDRPFSSNNDFMKTYNILEDAYLSLVWEHENDPDRDPR